MAVSSIIRQYADTCLLRTGYTEVDQYRGDNLIPWVAELEFGESLPTEYTLAAAVAAQNDTSITLTAAASETVTLYRDQVLYFPTDDVVASVLTTTEVTDAGVAVPVRPLEGALTLDSEVKVYPIYPILSFMSGGFVPQSTGTIAESRNKGQSLFTAKGVFQRSGTATGEGTAIRNDVGRAILENAVTGSKLVYIETRRPIYDCYGAGFNAYKYIAIVESSSPTSDASDFEKVNFTLSISGAPTRYTPLGSTLADIQAKCPEDVYLAKLVDNVC